MHTQESTLETVSVIGLGAMGFTLAKLLLQNGYRVTVWNRSSEKATPLVRDGATLAPSATAAIKASKVVVICVYDYKATYAIFETEEIDSVVADRVLIQLTTGSPQEALESEAWAHERGAMYLDGAIQAAPSQMGRSDTSILISGAEDVFRRSEAVLKTFGGHVVYLGESADAASTMDLATLSYVYGSVLGFIHGAHMAEASGIRVDTYGALIASIAPAFGDFLQYESTAIQKGDFTVSESPLRISVEATERILQQARAARINTEIPALAAGLFRRAAEAGYEHEEAAALIKVLRAKN